MATITIGFSRPKSRLAIIAHLIRLCEGGTPYSHVYLKWHSASLDRDLIYEAKGSGINFTSPIYFKDHVEVVHEFNLDISDETKTRIVQYCIDNAREKYGVLQILGIATVRLLRKLGVNIKNPFTAGMVCSELAGAVLNNFIGTDIKDLDLAGPADIYKILEKLDG
jgi:hypothetical protein